MIKLAVLGTGGMANAHAIAFSALRGVKLVAACDIDRERAEAYAKKHEISDVYTDVDEMLKRDDIDAVTNVTPDAFHAPLSLKVIQAGKHILCEKPLATNYADAKKMATAAKRKKVINMVNFSYRRSSALIRAGELISQGKLGEIKHVEARYYQSWLASTAWGVWQESPQWLWRLSSKHGSKGALGDVGVHILDFASFPVGPMKSIHCKLKTFPKAKNNRIGEYTLDANDSAVMTIEFKNGALGSVTTTRYATGHDNSLYLNVHGTEGALRIDLDQSYEELQLCTGKSRHTNDWKTVTCRTTPTIYQRFVKSIKTGENDIPDFARGAEIQKALDACFESDTNDQTVKL